MFVLAKKNIILRSANGETYLLRKDEMGTVPDKFTGSAYFAGLVKDGKVITVATAKDKEAQTAMEASETKAKAARKRVEKGE